MATHRLLHIANLVSFEELRDDFSMLFQRAGLIFLCDFIKRRKAGRFYHPSIAIIIHRSMLFVVMADDFRFGSRIPPCRVLRRFLLWHCCINVASIDIRLRVPALMCNRVAIGADSV